MKLLTSTSSIRRTAWNACRSCSPDSDSKCPDSFASRREAGCTTSPRCSRNSATGDWVSHWTSRSGSPLRASRRRWPGRGGRDRARWARRGRAPADDASCRHLAGRAGAGAPVTRSTKPLMARLTVIGSRAIGRWPEPSSSSSSPPVHSASCWARPSGWQRSSVPRITSTGWVDRAQQRLRVRHVLGVPGAVPDRELHLPGRGAGPPEDVLQLLGRVRLAQHLVEEEGGELRPALLEEVPVAHRPALVRRQLVLEVRGGLGPERQRRRVVVEPRPERDHALDPLGVQRRDQHRLPGAHADAHQHGAVHAGRVHHGHRVGHEVEVAVLRRVGGPVGPAVAPRVDGDDAVVLGRGTGPGPSTPGSARTSRSARTAPSAGPRPRPRR